MIRSKVIANPDRINRVDEELQRRARRAVGEAARTAAVVASARSRDWPFRSKGARGTHRGYEAGVVGNPLTHIFNKGSLGRRSAALKRDRRKDSWAVKRGSGYTADRHPEALTGDHGVAARDIFRPAILAGRRALKAALKRR